MAIQEFGENGDQDLVRQDVELDPTAGEGDQAFREGALARTDNVSLLNNPYARGLSDHRKWRS